MTTQPGLFDVEPVKTRKPKKVSDAPSWTSNTTKATLLRLHRRSRRREVDNGHARAVAPHRRRSPRALLLRARRAVAGRRPRGRDA